MAKTEKSWSIDGPDENELVWLLAVPHNRTPFSGIHDKITKFQSAQLAKKIATIRY